MPAVHFYRAIADDKGGMTLLYHKDLFIGVLVQPGTTARGSLHPEKRNGNASMFPCLKQIAVSMAELLPGNDRDHDSFLSARTVRFSAGTRCGSGLTNQAQSTFSAPSPASTTIPMLIC